MCKIESIVEYMRTTKEILAKISENNNQEIHQTGQLRIILFNLQIVGAGVPGVDPIADRLRETIETLHDGTYELVQHDRGKILCAINEIDEFLQDLLTECVFKHLEVCTCLKICHKRIMLHSSEGQKIKADFDSNDKIKDVRNEFKEMHML